MSWTIEEHGKGYALYSGRDDIHHGMNLVYLSDPDANWEKTKALIEAAPDLLEACQSAFMHMVANDEFGATMNKLDAAIAKARGEQ